MKKAIGLLLAALMLTGAVALAEDVPAAEPNPIADWIDGAATSVETWVKEGGELEVQAKAVRTVVPDTVSISIGASIENESEKEAQTQANTIINGVIAELKALGIEDNQMMTSGYNVTRRTRSKVGGLGGASATTYVASINMQVSVQDFDLINTILDVAAEQGANNIGNISFSYSKEGEAYQQALRDAIHTAKAKAELMADAAGVELQTMLRLTEGYTGGWYANSYAPMAMEEEMDSGSGAQIMAGEIEITASVTMVYRTK